MAIEERKLLEDYRRKLEEMVTAETITGPHWLSKRFCELFMSDGSLVEVRKRQQQRKLKDFQSKALKACGLQEHLTHHQLP